MKRAFDAFELFCFYYLGLPPEGGYRFSNANQMARYYGTSVGAVMEALRGHDLHPDTVVNTDFPMAGYQVEIQLASKEQAPERLRVMAERIFEEYRTRSGRRRDWASEIAADIRATRGGDS